MAKGELDRQINPESLGGGIELLQFDHTVGDASKRLSVIAARENIDFSIKAFEATDPEKRILRIWGKFKREPEGLSFHVTASDNNKYGTPDRIPHAVGATIAEIVASKWVKKWFSAIKLSEGSVKMYGEYLASDPRLKVTLRSQATGGRYIVTKKA